MQVWKPFLVTMMANGVARDAQYTKSTKKLESRNSFEKLVLCSAKLFTRFQ